MRSSAWCSCTSWCSGSWKANMLPSLQVFKYIQTYCLARSLNLSLRQNFLAVWTILTLACNLTEYWNKDFSRRGNVGELGDAPCSNLRKECMSLARHLRYLLCCVSSRRSVGMASRENIYNYSLANLHWSCGNPVPKYLCDWAMWTSLG